MRQGLPGRPRRTGTPGSEAEDVPVDDGEAEGQGTKATPVARRAAQANGVHLKGLKGTGAGGKITKSDVLSGGGDGAGPVAAEGEAKPLRGPAASLARAMNESRSIPTATSFRELPSTARRASARRSTRSSRSAA